MICVPNLYDLRAEFVSVRVCMIPSRSKFVGPNLRRFEFTGKPVTLQPDSGLFNSLGAGVVKLTTIKMDKTKQFNSLSVTFLFNQLQSTTLECCFARFLPVSKQNARIIAVKLL